MNEGSSMQSTNSTPQRPASSDRGGQYVRLANTLNPMTHSSGDEQIIEQAGMLIADVITFALSFGGDLRTLLERAVDAFRYISDAPEPDAAQVAAMNATHYLIRRGWGQRARADERGRVFVEAAVALAGLDDFKNEHPDDVAREWLPLVLADCFALDDLFELGLGELLEAALKQHNTT